MYEEFYWLRVYWLYLVFLGLLNWLRWWFEGFVIEVSDVGCKWLFVCDVFLVFIVIKVLYDVVFGDKIDLWFEDNFFSE